MKNSIDEIKQTNPPSTHPLPTAITPATQQASHINRLLGWAILPLRLFLGITFVYAGVQKLTDPQYFLPSSVGYIGNQIATFASGSPIHDFLINVAQPHAMFVGVLVAYGELAIGIATLLGLLLRPAALFGMLLNTLLFLSATWRVHPYFYGSDIVFVFCWLTLLLAGPINSVLPTLDALLVPRLLQFTPPIWQVQVAHALHFILGTPRPTPSLPDTFGGDTYSTTPFVGARFIAPARMRAVRGACGVGVEAPHPRRPGGMSPRSSGTPAPLSFQPSRRTFIWGAVTGGVSVLSLAWLSNLLHLIPQTTTIPGESTTATTATAPVSNTPGVIAQVSHIPTNSATNFTLTANGDPGVLIHLNNGQFVAYDAVCTHAGCPVSYDPASKLLLCPCHGSSFDPAQAAAVIQGPARIPLTRIPIHVNNATGTIMLGS